MAMFCQPFQALQNPVLAKHDIVVVRCMVLVKEPNVCLWFKGHLY